MRGGELLDKMELVDPAYVAAADRPPQLRRVRWKAWASVAACLALAVVSVAVVRMSRQAPLPIRQAPPRRASRQRPLAGPASISTTTAPNMCFSKTEVPLN